MKNVQIERAYYMQKERKRERNNTYKDGCEDEYENCIKKKLFDIDSL